MPHNPMPNRQCKTPHAKSPKQQRTVGAQVRPTEAREERDSRAGNRKRGDESPVARAERAVAVTGEGVVDEGDGGAPHQDQHPLEVELHVEKVDGLAVGHERVEGGREGEAQRHAEEVRAADGDVRGRGGMVTDWYLSEDEGCEAGEDQGAEDVGPDVDCLIWSGESS